MKVLEEMTHITLQDTHSGTLKLIQINVAPSRFWELAAAANESLSYPVRLYNYEQSTGMHVRREEDKKVNGDWYTLKPEEGAALMELLWRAGHGDGDIIQGPSSDGWCLVLEDIDFWKFILLIIQARHPEFKYHIVECSSFAV